MILSLIAAIGRNNEIGKNNTLLWDLPIDMKYFKETTKGHSIIMGKKTYKSIGHPLPNRTNIVLTTNQSFKEEGVKVYNSLESLKEFLESSLGEDEEVFVIGGEQIYKLFINKADKLYITYIDKSFPDADIFFPTIDIDKWVKTSDNKHSKNNKNIYNCNFVVYEKIN